MIKLSAIARSHNTKTGNIPSVYCGESIEDFRETCQGCPLLPGNVDRETKCYAWGGSPKLGFGAMALKASGQHTSKSLKGTGSTKPGKVYSVENAIDNRHPDARAMRVGAIGDPARVAKSWMRRAIRLGRKAGLAVLAYTHFWRFKYAQWLRRDCMASCDDISQADIAINRGWIPAAIWPGTSHKNPPSADTVETPAGNELLVCPAQKTDGVTCNDCRLCDASNRFWTKQSRIKGILFWEH